MGDAQVAFRVTGLVVGRTEVALSSDNVEVVVFRATVVVVLPYEATEPVTGSPVVAALKSHEEVVALAVAIILVIVDVIVVVVVVVLSPVLL